MRKKYKTWIQQLSESYIRQNLQEAQPPSEPMFPPGGPPPEPTFPPSGDPPSEPMFPPTRPSSSAAMRSGQTPPPPPPKKGPEVSSPYNTQRLFWNGEYWVIQEFEQDGNLIYNYVWDGKQWVQLAVPGVEIYRPRKNNTTQNKL
jgi:hypothetical protein